MSLIDKTYDEFQEIDLEEFYDMLWTAVSEKTVSTAYIDKHRDFIDMLTYDYWRIFEMDNDITIRTLARIIEINFFYLFRYKPSVNNIEEIRD